MSQGPARVQKAGAEPEGPAPATIKYLQNQPALLAERNALVGAAVRGGAAAVVVALTQRQRAATRQRDVGQVEEDGGRARGLQTGLDLGLAHAVATTTV